MVDWLVAEGIYENLENKEPQSLRMQSASKREVCYQRRDDYHKCLDTLPEDPAKACSKQKIDLDGACPPSWVSYFQKQREREVMLQYQLEAARGDKPV